jgi:hypothetical protein
VLAQHAQERLMTSKTIAEQIAGAVNHFRSYSKLYSIGITAIAALGSIMVTGKAPVPVQELAKNTLQDTLGMNQEQEKLKNDVALLQQELSRHQLNMDLQLQHLKAESQNYTLSLLFDIATKPEFK